MSFISSLSGVTSGLGRGLEDLFTLGTAELARKYGGSGADTAFGDIDKGVGANWEAGAAGGSAILGGDALASAFGGSGSGATGSTAAPSAASSSPFSMSRLIAGGMGQGGQPQASSEDPLADSLGQVSQNNNAYQQAIQNNFRRTMPIY